MNVYSAHSLNVQKNVLCRTGDDQCNLSTSGTIWAFSYFKMEEKQLDMLTVNLQIPVLYNIFQYFVSFSKRMHRNLRSVAPERDLLTCSSPFSEIALTTDVSSFTV